MILPRKVIAVKAVVIVTKHRDFPTRVFVIPLSVLKAAYPQCESRPVLLGIPSKNEPVYQGRVPRINYWDYIDAWQHLTPEPDSS